MRAREVRKLMEKRTNSSRPTCHHTFELLSELTEKGINTKNGVGHSAGAMLIQGELNSDGDVTTAEALL